MFELKKTEGKARRGEFTCAHGTVQTPVFMNPLGMEKESYWELTEFCLCDTINKIQKIRR